MELKKKGLCLLFCAVIFAGLAPVAVRGDGEAQSGQKLTVNGQSVTAEAYNIEGSNYFRLRDLAYLLMNTGSRFSVEWDGDRSAVIIRTGSTYTPNGSELDLSGSEQEAAMVYSPQTLVVDGMEYADVPAFNIRDSNFFRLRDLGELLHFGVRYSARDDTARIYSLDSDRAQTFSQVKNAVLTDGNGSIRGNISLAHVELLGEGKLLESHIFYDSASDMLCFSMLLPWEQENCSGELASTAGVYPDAEEIDYSFVLTVNGVDGDYISGTGRQSPEAFRPGEVLPFSDYAGTVSQAQAEEVAHNMFLLALQYGDQLLADRQLGGGQNVVTEVFGFSNLYRT